MNLINSLEKSSCIQPPPSQPFNPCTNGLTECKWVKKAIKTDSKNNAQRNRDMHKLTKRNRETYCIYDTFPGYSCFKFTNGFTLMLKPSANFRYSSPQFRWKLLSFFVCYVRTATKFTHQHWFLHLGPTIGCLAFWKNALIMYMYIHSLMDGDTNCCHWLISKLFILHGGTANVSL